MKNRITLLMIFLLASVYAYGSGYQVLLQGNRITGMGNLSVALKPDASSIFFNPGATAFMNKNGIMVGANFIYSHNAFWNSTVENSTYTANSDNPVGTPFHAYVVWGPEGSKFKFGVSAVTPFGSGVNWGDTWMGRDLLNDIKLEAIQVQPTVSYKLNDNLSVGAGLIIGFGSVNLKRTLLYDGVDGNGSVELDGSAKTAFGFNVGIFYSPSEMVDLGVNYRSKVEMTLENGDATFSLPSSLYTLIPQTNKFDASLPLPSVFGVGITLHPTEQFDIGTEFNYVGWSAYKSLDFDFKNPGPDDTSSPRNYKDSWVLHLGAEYRLMQKLQLRAGIYYDKTPVEKGYMTAETPDANRVGLTAGVGYSISEHLQLDASFLFVNGMKREQTVQEAISANTYDPAAGTRDVMPGTYRLNAFIPGLTISYNF